MQRRNARRKWDSEYSPFYKVVLQADVYIDPRWIQVTMTSGQRVSWVEVITCTKGLRLRSMGLLRCLRLSLRLFICIRAKKTKGNRERDGSGSLRGEKA